MTYRLVIAGLAALMATSSAQGQDPAFQFFNGFSGRYHCSGNWIDLTLRVNAISGPLGMDDPGAGVVGVLTLLVHRSLTGSDAVTYKLRGPTTARRASSA